MCLASRLGRDQASIQQVSLWRLPGFWPGDGIRFMVSARWHVLLRSAGIQSVTGQHTDHICRPVCHKFSTHHNWRRRHTPGSRHAAQFDTVICAASLVVDRLVGWQHATAVPLGLPSLLGLFHRLHWLRFLLQAGGSDCVTRLSTCFNGCSRAPVWLAHPASLLWLLLLAGAHAVHVWGSRFITERHGEDISFWVVGAYIASSTS